MANGKVQDVTDATFNGALPKNGRALLVFKASWCGPCKALAPHITKIAEEFPDVAVLRIDNDAAPKTMTAYKIRHFPTVMVVSLANGELLPGARDVGMTPASIRAGLTG